VTCGIHRQPAAAEAVARLALLACAFAALRRTIVDPAATQDRANAGKEQAQRKGLRDIIVGAHFEPGFLVALVILAGQEDDGKGRALAQPGEQFHSVHARHFDVEHRKVRRVLGKCTQRGFAIGIDPRLEPFRLQRDRDRGEDIAIVIDQRDHTPVVAAQGGYGFAGVGDLVHGRFAVGACRFREVACAQQSHNARECDVAPFKSGVSV